MALNCCFHRHNNTKAISLVEVTVAMAILAIGLVGITRGFSQSAQAAALSNDMVLAAFMAQSKLYELELMEGQKKINEASTEAQSKTARFDAAYAVNHNASLSLYDLKIDVKWSRAGAQRNLVLETYLR